jgi:signal transduction histidine kinase
MNPEKKPIVSKLQANTGLNLVYNGQVIATQRLASLQEYAMNSATTPANIPTADPAAHRGRWWMIGGALLIGPLVLLLLRLAPELDLKYQSPLAHFWIVTTATVIAMLMACLVLRAAVVRRDGRAFLISMAFLALSSIFFVHAVSTPGVVFANTGHATRWSTPLALLTAAIILAVSTHKRFAEQSRLMDHWKGWILLGFGLWLAYALFMLIYVPDHALPAETAPPAAAVSADSTEADEYNESAHGADHAAASGTDALAAPPTAPKTIQQELLDLAPRLFPLITALNLLCYGFAALVYGRRWWRTPTRPLAALTVGAILLAETSLAAQFGITWQLSFWSYHVLLLSATAVVTYGVVMGVERTGSLTSAIEGLLLRSTVDRQRVAFQDGMATLLEALENGDRQAIPELRRDLRQRFALAEDQLDLLQHAVAVVAQDREQARRLQALVDISHTVTLDLSPDLLIQNVVTTLAKTTNAALAAVGLIEDATMTVQAAHQIVNGQAATALVSIPSTALPLKWLLSTDVPYNVALDGGLAPLAINANEALLVPLSHHNHLLGVLFFQPSQSDELDPRIESVLQSVAAHLATGLTNARLYQALQHEHEQLQRSEQTKEQMSQMIVHDLKNPLTAIINYLDILKRDAITPTQSELIQGARRSSVSMINLVTDLLDSARLQEGRLDLRLAVVNVGELLERSADDLRLWADQEHKLLTVEVPEHTLAIYVDAHLLERVLANLISNAIKHTPITSRITISASCDDQGVAIQVHDNGPGIPHEQQALLFERFSSTANSPTNGRQRNSGLGLHFCKLAVEAHAGQLRVDSEPPHGTTFTISLPASVLVGEPVASI